MNVYEYTRIYHFQFKIRGNYDHFFLSFLEEMMINILWGRKVELFFSSKVLDCELGGQMA